MGIGYRIKEAREQLGLTQTELGQKVGVTGSSITNYEKETSHPKEQIIYKLMETLGVDANYLFQDCIHISPKENDIDLSEYKHVKKYRALDSHGKDMVDTVLEKEYSRCLELQNPKIAPYVKESPSDYLTANAAHERTDIEFTEEDRKADEDMLD